MTDNTTAFLLRIDQETKDKLVIRAAKKERSLNNYLCALLHDLTKLDEEEEDETDQETA